MQTICCAGVYQLWSINNRWGPPCRHSLNPYLPFQPSVSFLKFLHSESSHGARRGIGIDYQNISKFVPLTPQCKRCFCWICYMPPHLG